MNWMRYSVIIAIILSLLILPANLHSIEDEYFKKAALIKIFTQYIQWPKGSSVKDKSQPFIIGLLGESPINQILEKGMATKKSKIKGKKVEVRRFSQLEGIDKCNILFISNPVRFQLESIIKITRDKPILTIADTEGFAEKGILFNLFINNEQIAFEANISAIRASKLEVASELLSVSKIIKPSGN
jgi:hypothetical protein